MSDAYSSLSTPAGHRSSGTESRRSVEAPLTLTDKPPRTLGAGAQTAMWASFGVTLFGPLTGALVTQSVGSLGGGLAACALGTLVGALLLGGAAGIGAHTGTPSMVGLRGLLGRGASVVPTVLNIAQNIGWAMMEIIVITSAATHIVGAAWHWPFVIVAGALCTLMAIRPLGSVKILRTVMLWLVLAGSIYLFVMVLRQPSHAIGQDAVIGFWPGVDLAAAQVVSFAPLAADYSRHATSGRSAFASSTAGYGVAIFAYYALGVFAVAHLGGDLAGTNLLAALMVLPVGGLAIGLLLLDELDNAFANVYSSTVSVHNLAPRLDRRVISVAVGVVATVLAGLAGFDQYEGFLYLIGSAFVPLFTVAVVDFFVTRRGRWDTTSAAPFRWSPTLAWVIGFVAYQLIYPGSIPGWSDLWAGLAQALGFVAPGWLGSTLGSIVVSAVAAAGLGAIDTAVRRHRAEERLA
ncbi:purine-cytosine permease family protein [Propionibacterium freudenreichii]|uniref:purine-cytosine permease family protein n=1 Tax=Propionibacterium freudenreichii TaxID=1744 RepID=UPI0021A80F67|nr:cytosine permease [Propionibacterium freudenreichii]